MTALDRSVSPSTGMTPPAGRVVHRTRGRLHGLVTRLMSPSDLGKQPRPFVFLDHTDTDAELVVGSAVKHPHDLLLSYCSVHISAAALREGESRIQQIGNRLRAEGRCSPEACGPVGHERGVGA
jgi:hypothetical protein